MPHLDCCACLTRLDTGRAPVGSRVRCPCCGQALAVPPLPPTELHRPGPPPLPTPPPARPVEVEPIDADPTRGPRTFFELFVALVNRFSTLEWIAIAWLSILAAAGVVAGVLFLIDRSRGQ